MELTEAKPICECGICVACIDAIEYALEMEECGSPAGSVAGVSDIPDFMGVVCKECGKPFLVWQTKHGQDAKDHAEVRRYVKQGHVEKVIDISIVGDITKWCQGHPA